MLQRYHCEKLLRTNEPLTMILGSLHNPVQSKSQARITAIPEDQQRKCGLGSSTAWTAKLLTVSTLLSEQEDNVGKAGAFIGINRVVTCVHEAWPCGSLETLCDIISMKQEGVSSATIPVWMMLTKDVRARKRS